MSRSGLPNRAIVFWVLKWICAVCDSGQLQQFRRSVALVLRFLQCFEKDWLDALAIKAHQRRDVLARLNHQSSLGQLTLLAASAGRSRCSPSVYIRQNQSAQILSIL